MKLVHLRNRRPDDDVSLSDGELFNVKRAPYARHLETAPDRQQVCSSWTIFNCFIHNKTQKSQCSNHRAQNNGSMHRDHLDSTGKGACACARHGAFIPHCMVDFQKGERSVQFKWIW